MNVSFTSNKLTNSAVVDSTTGQLLFELTTPFGLRRHTTLRDVQNNVIGAHQRGAIHDEVTYQGQTMRVSEWLHRNSVFSSSRTFTAANGRSYKWEKGGMFNKGWQLSDCQTGQLVASAHNKKLFSTKKLNIEVVQDGLPILDAIVLSFLICELRSRRQQNAAAASAGAGAS
ncbi:uncharacterized protein TRAVEDRAFT_46999 [Trametes versicolor FP-101664 SS1]|uniref:uncharacterized protein n=1 Tax=Trametes versicolor (strain FP-101664) TaxID=717944 RepID=UPI00046237C6|nr:uncharacterized protein TRAVEDRAFT_46999 [Trametes versicolor FP-101664 SS1]EIW59696.1 hypothetical protein TRAVEDRAFT_46999 [Trametes versicolor FP-101664 SS1]